MKYAGFLKRLAAYVIDSLIISVPFYLLGLLFTIGTIVSAEQSGETMTKIGLVVIPIIGYITFFIYFAYFESSASQATIGKKALNLKVVGSDGERISFLKALGRNLGKVISAFIFMIGFIMAAFTAKKQALHDMMASTLVVEASKAESLDADF